ncbi:MAG: hypothetical protein WAM95_10710 [Bacillus sp. (in: firmicutes)]
MQKRNVLQASESQISAAPKNGRQKKPIRKKKKAKASIEWGRLFRVACLLLLVGIIVFHYYLFTEKALVNYYQTIWMNYKPILSPILMIIGYSLIIFLLGYRFGKRKR